MVPMTWSLMNLKSIVASIAWSPMHIKGRCWWVINFLFVSWWPYSYCWYRHKCLVVTQWSRDKYKRHHAILCLSIQYNQYDLLLSWSIWSESSPTIFFFFLFDSFTWIWSCMIRLIRWIRWTGWTSWKDLLIYCLHYFKEVLSAPSVLFKFLDEFFSNKQGGEWWLKESSCITNPQCWTQDFQFLYFTLMDSLLIFFSFQLSSFLVFLSMAAWTNVVH